MIRAFSYLRFSSPEQAQGDSARRQSDLAAAYAARHGLELDEKLTFKDLGVSAFRGRNAADGRLGDFLEAVKAGVVPQGSHLLVESLDRISRQAVLPALDTLRALVGSGITVVTLSDGAVYTKEKIETEFVKLMAALLTFARANEESVMKGTRVRAAWDRKKREAASKPLTSNCPAWLCLKADRSAYEIIPGRDAVVRRVFEMAASGMGGHTIAATFNAEGIAPFGDGRRKPGTHWHRSYVVKILASDAPLGTYVPHSGHYVNGRLVRTPWAPVLGYYPAVVDEETVRRARLVTGPGENPKRGRHATAALRNILAGLGRCPLCAGTMTRVSKGSGVKAGKPYLVCAKAKAGAGCTYRAVALDNVEIALRTRADELVFKPTLADQDPEADLLMEERADLARRIDNVLDAIEQGTGSAAMQGRLVALEVRHREVEESLRALTIHKDGTREPLVAKRMVDLRAALKADPFDLEAANTALRLCADRVEVNYRSGELLVSWRHGGVTDLTFAMPEGEEDAASASPTAAPPPTHTPADKTNRSRAPTGGGAKRATLSTPKKDD